MEYANVIWSPTFKKDIISIENVQRRATRLATGMKGLTYEQRLKELGLPTLLYRRERTDILQLFKIMHNYEEVHIDNVNRNESATTRGHSLKLKKSFTKSRFGQNRFSNRVVNNWNSLSNSTVESVSVNNFKSNLNIDWKFKDGKFNV